jgi:uncharacterized protein (TIGR00369 family)
VTSFEAVDAGYGERVRTSFAAQGIMAHLGAELLEVAPGMCSIGLAWRPELTQQDGFFHAGAVTTIADSAGGYAAFSLMPADARVLTVELKINLMAPARGERLVARGIVERAGRTLTVVQATVDAVSGPSVTQVALMLATVMCLRPRRSAAPEA